MYSKATTLLATVLTTAVLAASQTVGPAYVENWEGAHNEPTPDNRAADGWYTQIVSKTPAANGIPPSIQVLFKHGNIWQWGADNTPLYGVEVNGFDTDGEPFVNYMNFNTSSVAPTRTGYTQGVWGEGNNQITFTASRDRSYWDIKLKTEWIQGVITVRSNSPAVTGCGGRRVSDDPFFSHLVEGKKLTAAEDILFNQNGLRIAMFAADADVDVTIAGKRVQFTGSGYKDTHWTPNPFNDFINTWHVMIGNVGPYSFMTMAIRPIDGENMVNLAHLIDEDGNILSSQCNLIGSRENDISIIETSGEVADTGVIAPTTYDLTFVLENGERLAFTTQHIAENPSFSFYHRWTAILTGGPVGGRNYSGYGVNEWINGGNFSRWVDIYEP